MASVVRAGRARLALLGVVACTGCESPEVAPQPLDPVALATDRLQTGLPPNDPIDIDTLVLTAVKGSPVRRQAETRLANAIAAVQLTEVGQPFVYAPELEYHTEGAPWTLGLSVERPFTRQALRTARTDAAVADRVAAQWETERIGWTVRDQILQALARIEHARLEIGFAEEEASLREVVESTLRQGVAAGVARPLDARRAAARALQARLDLDAARSRLHEAETGLAAALGVSRTAVQAREIRPGLRARLRTQVTVDEFESLLRRALVRRSDILVSIAAYGAAEARLRLTLAELTPDLVLGPGILWDQKDFVLRLAGAVVPVPAVTDARLAIALAQRDEARFAFEETQARVLADAEGAWTQLETARREAASAAAEIAAAEDDLQQIVAAIDQRTLPAAVRPEADLRLLAARRAAAKAEIRHMMALIQLEVAVERVLRDGASPQDAPWRDDAPEGG